MINQQQWSIEREWLNRVMEVIRVQLATYEHQAEVFHQKVVKTNREMWQDVQNPKGDFEEDYNIYIMAIQFNKERKTQMLTYDYYVKGVEKLKRIYANPYFGRVDFRENGRDEVEAIYIGLATLFDPDEYCLVYDWRAPISSIFYDYEPGPVEYSLRDGNIQGEMLLKRQYRIAKGELELMFDTNIKIDDEILQQILSQHTTGRMKQIVTSIQREQNRVIRDDSHQLLIVQGPAGSGKTSIALHRAAFLLYKYRNIIQSENILIFSPNQVFSDYISNVLPELGEENMFQMTFQEYAEDYLGQRFAIEDVYDQLEYFYSGPSPDEAKVRISGTRYKSSREFVRVIKNYLRLIEREHPFEDLIFNGEVLASKEELSRLWLQEYKYLPARKRGRKLQRRLLVLLKPLKKKRIQEIKEKLLQENKVESIDWTGESITLVRQELVPLKEKLRQMAEFDPFELYVELFKDSTMLARVAEGTAVPEDFAAIAEQTLAAFERKVIPYEDVAPLLYLKRALTGEWKIEGRIKHVFVDEAQDYSPFQYEIIHQLFPRCQLTMLGDVNQSIHPYHGVGNYRVIEEIVGAQSSESIRLKKSYRSTIEITNFAQRMIATEGDQEPINRAGKKPQVIRLADESVLKAALLKGIAGVREEGARSIAVICKTAAESQRIYELLKEDVHVSLVTKEDQEFKRDVTALVVPSYMAKGLEFDAVLVHMNAEYNYREEEVRLLYMVCSRALHHLQVYYTDELSPLIAGMESEYYEEVMDFVL